jgi:uncharacterized protein YggE
MTRRPASIRSRIALAAALIGLAPSLLAAQAPKADDDVLKMEDTPKLTVRGEAELEKPADRVELSIGVLTEAATAAPALDVNTKRMKAIVKAIEDQGLGTDEYRTGRFRVRPVYSRRPRQADPDWMPRITGYEVANSVIVKTKKLDKVGGLIESANAAGANTVEVSGFDLADDRQYRAEAIATATRNAVEDAGTLADAASLKLVRILAVNLDNIPVRGSEMRFAAPRGRAMSEAGGAPPINPGDVTIRATVTIVYEIAPAATD